MDGLSVQNALRSARFSALLLSIDPSDPAPKSFHSLSKPHEGMNAVMKLPPEDSPVVSGGGARKG